MADQKKISKAREIFESLDTDENGKISREELSLIVPADSLEEVFSQLDTEKNGIVTLPEFIKAFDMFNNDDDDPGTPGIPTLGGAKVDMNVVAEKKEKYKARKSLSVSDEREGRFKKIRDLMTGNDEMLGVEEIKQAIGFLCPRGFTPDETKNVKDFFETQGCVSAESSIIVSIIKASHQVERKKAEDGEWDDARFIQTFLDKLVSVGINSKKIGGKGETKDDIIKNLTQEKHYLNERIKQLTEKVNKHKQNASDYSNEIQELRFKLGEGDAGNKTVEQRLKEKSEELKCFESMVEQLQGDKRELERNLKNLKQHLETDRAMLKVKKTMIKTTSRELKSLRERMSGLLETHAEHNKLELKKKVGKMTAIMTRRRLIRELQVDNERIPQLEVDNIRLKEHVAKLQQEAKEYLRVMDSYREKRPSTGAGIEIHREDNSNVRVTCIVGDEEELEVLRKKLKEEIEKNKNLWAQLNDTKNLLEEEKQAREEAEQKCKVLTEKCELLTNQVTEMRAKITQLEKDLDSEKAARKREAEEYEAKIAQLEEQLKQLQQKLQEEIEARKALENQLSELGDDSQTKITNMTREIAELKRRVKELESELEAERTRRENLEQELARVKSDLEFEREKRKQLEEELAKTQTELDKALKKIKELEAKLLSQESEVVTIVEAKVFVEAKINVETKDDDYLIKLTPDQQAELSAYTRCFNNTLGSDPDLSYCMPIHEASSDLLFKLGDGLLVAKFINQCVPGTIDTRALNLPQDGILDSDGMMENLTLCMGSAKAIGIPLENENKLVEEVLNPTDPDFILGFLYELIKTKYFQCISVRKKPELIDICENPDTGLSGLKLKELETDELKTLDPDSLLMRWLNWHFIAEAGGPLDSIITNWGNDLANSLAYSSILDRIAECKHDTSIPDKSKTDGKRAKHVTDKATHLKVDHFHIPQNITSGNPRLNLLFTACLFNCSTGFNDDDDLEDGEVKTIENNPYGMTGAGLSEEDREERAYRMWINSCGIRNCFVSNLFLDSRDGLKLLKLIDHIRPGTVNWKRVELNPKGKFKKINNCNLVIKYCKSPLNLKIKLISGENLHGVVKKLVLAVMGQLMRYDTMMKLEKAFKTIGLKKGDNEEKAIMNWANEVVMKNKHELNALEKIRSFKDKKLSNCLFFFNLLWAIQPRLVKWTMVNTNPESIKDKNRNAGYLISVARKLGAEVYLLPHDIVMCKQKQIMLFIGSIMAVAHK